MKKKLLTFSAVVLVVFAALADFNLYDTSTVSTLADAATVTATTTNSAVAINGYVGKSIIVLFATPRFNLTTGTNTVTIQDSANGTSGWTNITSLSYAFWTNSVQTLPIEAGAQKKYIRTIHTIAGTNEFATSVVLIGRLKYN